jgi:uncharacterized protein DUF3310
MGNMEEQQLKIPSCTRQLTEEEIRLAEGRQYEKADIFKRVDEPITQLGSGSVTFGSIDGPKIQPSDIPKKIDRTIDHPWHYHSFPYEAILVIEAWSLNFNLGNTVKYISRAGRKTPDKLKDLKKAAWYLNREIENLEKLPKE